MFTILIPVLKQGFLESQLCWLSKQTYRDFTVIAMDAFYRHTRYQPWVSKQYPFQFHHIPLIHNVQFPKRCDYSIKNNLALLSPTNEFLFLSDTAYVAPNFAKVVSDYVLNSRFVAFDSTTVLYNAYDQGRHQLDLNGQTNELSRPTLLFDRKTFFYILNGFDEATTYCFEVDSIFERMVNTGHKVSPEKGVVFHILHDPAMNSFGKFWKKPCEKCEALFPRWKFEMAMDTKEFPMVGDTESMGQMTFVDRTLGIPMFQCPNCGFGGCYEPALYGELIMRERLTEAPQSALEGRVGRNLGKVYETMVSKVDSDISAKMAFLRTTY